jgi:hypothetical protein
MTHRRNLSKVGPRDPSNRGHPQADLRDRSFWAPYVQSFYLIVRSSEAPVTCGLSALCFNGIRS